VIITPGLEVIDVVTPEVATTAGVTDEEESCDVGWVGADSDFWATLLWGSCEVDAEALFASLAFSISNFLRCSCSFFVFLAFSSSIRASLAE